MALDKVRIEHAPLSNRIVLARFGKDPTLALETVDATGQFLKAATSYLFDGQMPEVGAMRAITYGADDEQFKLTIERVPA